MEESKDLQTEINYESNDKKSPSNQAEKKKNSKLKYLIYLCVVLLITAVVIWYNLVQPVSDDDPTLVYEKVPYFLANMNITFLCIFFSVILIVFLINSFMMFLYCRMYQRHYRFHQGLAAQAIDIFYSSITPGAYGGEIAKVFVFNKQGVPISNGASVMVMNFIVYQSVLIFFGLISIITRFDQILNIPAFPVDIEVFGNPIPPIPFWIFIVLGFSLNIFTILLLILMSSSRRLHNFVINHGINFLGKIHLVKNVEKKKENLRLQVENYRIELARLRSNLPFTIFLVFLTFLILVGTGLYPFLSGLTLNGFVGFNGDVNYFLKAYDSIVFTNFHQMVTGLIPIPGTAGISEYVFERLFGSSSNFFSSDFYRSGGGNLVLLFWRIMSFYIPFIICGIVAATYKSRGVRIKDRILPTGNRKTMLTLSFETLEDRKETLNLQLKDKEIEKNKHDEEKREKKERHKK